MMMLCRVLVLAEDWVFEEVWRIDVMREDFVFYGEVRGFGHLCLVG